MAMRSAVASPRVRAVVAPERRAASSGTGRVVRRAAIVAALVAAVAAAGWRSSGGAGVAASRTIIERTNAARASAGLPPLATDPQLTRAAKLYAREMAHDGWFDHTARDGAGVDARAEAAGYADWQYLAENLATGAGPADPDAVVDGWLSSPDHRRNILSPELRDAGVACYVAEGRYWCAQEFGARAR